MDFAITQYRGDTGQYIGNNIAMERHRACNYMCVVYSGYIRILYVIIVRAFLSFEVVEVFLSSCSKAQP